MDDVLVIRTFGGFSITVSGRTQPEHLTTKAKALLVYCACAGRASRREYLSELLWPGRTQGQSLTNLRKLLVELRDHVDPWLNITRDSVGIGEAPLWLDCAELERALRLLEPDLPSDSQINDRLESAISLYQGDFLEGLDVESEEFDAWVSLERERFRLSVLGGYDHLIESYSQAGEPAAALDVIERLLRLDPLRERTYCLSMRLLAESGNREAALRQYHVCEQVLDEELGIAPGPQTVDLYERIRAGSVPMSSPVATVFRPAEVQLPAQATSFVGREQELHDLMGMVSSPDCRLLTIAGSGGSGKTRLAMELARRAADSFRDGVCFVPLAPVAAADVFPSAVLAALSVHPGENETDLEQVMIRNLLGRHLLLVLDNLEHLLPIPVLSRLLERTDNLKLIATSRQPLGVSWEWLYALEGLPVPALSAVDGTTGFGSVQLFADRARRANLRFRLESDLEGVARICRLVEGMPLGIELAAAWTPVLSLTEIESQMLALEAPYEGDDVRHTSLPALFESMWALLDERDRRVLLRLSVFAGGFTAEAAAAVAEASHLDLMRLARRFLISANPAAGRYDIHQLLVQFLRKKLGQSRGMEAETLAAHSGFFLGLVHRLSGDIRTADPGAAEKVMLSDIDNIRVAWEWACAAHQFELIYSACATLNLLLMMNGMHHEAMGVFRHALQALLTGPESLERDRVELALQSCLIASLVTSASWEDGRLWPVTERIIELATRLGDDLQLMNGLTSLSSLYFNEEWEKGLRVAQQSLVVADRLGALYRMLGHSMNETAFLWTGHLEEAITHATAARDLHAPGASGIGTTLVGMDLLAACLSHRSCALTLYGLAEQGMRDATEAQARAVGLNQPLALCFALSFTIIGLICTRQTVESHAAAMRIKELADRHGLGHYRWQWHAYSVVGMIQRGDYAAGISALIPAIEHQRGTGITHNMPCWLAHLGVAYGHVGSVDLGLSQIDAAYALLERTGERMHESVVHRFRGELLRMQGDVTGATNAFERALQVAHRQHALFYELQAALSLGQLLVAHDRPLEACARVQLVYSAFVEGFDRPDLVDARAFLEALDPETIRMGRTTEQQTSPSSTG